MGGFRIAVKMITNGTFRTITRGDHAEHHSGAAHRRCDTPSKPKESEDCEKGKDPKNSRIKLN